MASQWQVCPVCGGRGVVSYPPNTPLGSGYTSSSTGPWQCEVCQGKKIIYPPSPSDPKPTEEAP